MATTLADLRTRARARADMTGSTFVTDAELDSYINQGFMELYDIVVGAFEDYFTNSTPSNLTITSGNSVALPADFYKLRGLDYNNSGLWTAVHEYNFDERNVKGTSGIWWSDLTPGAGRMFRIIGETLTIAPASNALGTYRLYYVPAATLLTLSTSQLPNSLSKFGWDEYIVLYAAERMLAKEESNVSDLVRQRGEIAGRISAMAQNRQVDRSERIQDVQYNLPNGRWWF